MARVWLEVGNLPGPARTATANVQLDCIRLALAFDAGYFGFCSASTPAGFTALDEVAVQAALEQLAARPIPAEPGAQGLRGRTKEIINRLPEPWQAPAMAFGRAGSRLLRGAAPEPVIPMDSVADVEPQGPFAPGDVYVTLWPLDGGVQRMLDRLREKLRVQVVALGKRETAAQLLQKALVLASQTGAGFEERLQHLYMALLQPGDLCIDIGAHTGRHSLPMSLAVGAAGRVAAFEPNPPIAARLRARLELLSIGNVAVHEAALSDEAGTAEFVVAVESPEESGLRQRVLYTAPTRTERVTVRLAQLDSLRLSNPRFIKLDTEGAEYKVLLGARETIAQALPVVAFEFGANSYAAYDVDPDDVFEYFATLDYEMFNILGERLAKAEFSEASRAQNYWDYVACSRRMAPRVAAALRSFQ